MLFIGIAGHLVRYLPLQKSDWAPYWTILISDERVVNMKLSPISDLHYVRTYSAMRHGGSVKACLTVVLLSRVQIQSLPSPQLTANLLVGCHLGWHLAVCWPLWGATEEKIMRNEPLVHQKHIKKKKHILPITGKIQDSSCGRYSAREKNTGPAGLLNSLMWSV